MFQSVNRYVDFIVDNNLTQAQFLFLYLIRRKNFDAISKYKTRFKAPDGSMIGEFAKAELIERGFLVHTGEGETANDYMVSEKFNAIFLKNHFEAADEMWKAYPGYVRIKGENIPLTNMDKYAFSNIYAERIDFSVQEHAEVLKDLEFGKQHNLIKQTIENFTRSESWLKIREIRIGQRKVQEVSSLTKEF